MIKLDITPQGYTKHKAETKLEFNINKPTEILKRKLKKCINKEKVRNTVQ